MSTEALSSEILGGNEISAKELLESLGDRVLIGDAAESRRFAKRRQKNDRRDAGLILELLLKGKFPLVHRPTFESGEVLSCCATDTSRCRV